MYHHSRTNKILESITKQKKKYDLRTNRILESIKKSIERYEEIIKVDTNIPVIFESRFKCKKCDAGFDIYKKYWYHQWKCEVNPKRKKELDDIYKSFEKTEQQEKEDEEKENKENYDEYVKITGITDDCRVVKLLERIQTLRTKMRKEKDHLQYHEKVFDNIRNYIEDKYYIQNK